MLNQKEINKKKKRVFIETIKKHEYFVYKNFL